MRTVDDIIQLLRQVKDPEVPVLDVVEMGMVREVRINGDTVEVDITPTYTGCPAMQVIEEQIQQTLQEAGIQEVAIRTVLHPPWTTEWMPESARRKLREYGIAPPQKIGQAESNPFVEQDRTVPCPYCGADDTRRTSEFGSTPCKALYYCNACRQPFEHFKCI